jgi:predicted transport protein
MSPLFEISPDRRTVRQLPANRVELEKHLQRLIEGNLESILGVRLVSSEFEMRGDQQGRIDTMGLDADDSPTIIEYKRQENESVINQGLYYMSWLIEHRGDFELAARNRLGFDISVNWSHPRLIVIAQTFVKWDTYAVKRMGEGIELWRYVIYGDNLLFLEQVYGQQRTLATPAVVVTPEDLSTLPPDTYTIDDHARNGVEPIRTVFLSLRDQILGLAGEDGEIIETPRKLYVAYRHGKNFCEVEVQKRTLKVYVDVPFEELEEHPSISRDLSNVGHWGTGSSLFMVKTDDDISVVMKAIFQSYLRTL